MENIFKTVLWYIFDWMDVHEHTINGKNVKLFYDESDSLFWVLIDNHNADKLLKKIWKLWNDRLFIKWDWIELNTELYDLISNFIEYD